MNISQRFIKKIDKIIRSFGHHYFQFHMAFTGNHHPSSYPYISGDSFRILADYIYENGVSFNPDDIKLGDIIFVSQGCLLTYLQTVHTNITEPYILICHNGDEPVDEKIVACIDDKIIHFFAQDVIYAHHKITPIPIGLENLHFYINGITNIFTKIQRNFSEQNTIRVNKIFYKFNVSTNSHERELAKFYFESHPLSKTTTLFLAPRRYLKNLCRYKFVASPPGNGVDCIRTWESLYIKTIPIVKYGVAMKYFASLGLPIWVISDWHELDNFTGEMLSKKYESFLQKAKWDALYMDFWIQKITAIQQQVRDN